MPAWVAEANWPEAWSFIYFSPIVKDGSNYIVYTGGYNIAKFYKYDLTTNTWTELADPSAVVGGGIAMSPDESKLATRFVGAGNDEYLRIYNVTGNSWSTSSHIPIIPGQAITRVRGMVWTDNDTVWVIAQGYNPGHRMKYMKYVVSTNTWTQYTNYFEPTIYAGYSGMTINSAGTTVYAGNLGGTPEYCTKYVIATDTYSYIRPNGGGAWRFCVNFDRNAKLWQYDTLTTYLGYRYFDCDTETVSDTIFPNNPLKNSPYWYFCGIYGVEYIIAWHRTTEPKLYSYLGILPPTATTNPATAIR